MALIMMAAMGLMGCSVTNKAAGQRCKVTSYSDGKPTEVHVEDTAELESLVGELVLGTDDALKMRTTSAIIGQEKKRGCLEIVFHDQMTIETQGMTFNFKKILLPRQDPALTSKVKFYCGSKSYASPPYINSNGVTVMEKIMELCKTH